MFGWQAIAVDVTTARYEIKQAAVDIERGKLTIKMPAGCDGAVDLNERQAMALQRAIGTALTFMRRVS